LQFLQVSLNKRPEEKSKAGNWVSPTHVTHAELKFVPFLTSSNGKDVSPAQVYQAKEKLVPLLTSARGKDVSARHLYHALENTVPEPIATVWKEVMLSHSSQADVKSVPPLKLRAGNEMSAVQFDQAESKLTGDWVLNVTTGNDVSPVQKYQAAYMSVAELKSSAGSVVNA
jgi:hypothetical protein